MSDSAILWTVSPPGSSVLGILQARILEWAAMPSSRDLPDPGIEPVSLMSPASAGRFFTTSATCACWSHFLESHHSFSINSLKYLPHFLQHTEEWWYMLHFKYIHRGNSRGLYNYHLEPVVLITGSNHRQTCDLSQCRRNRTKMLTSLLKQ